MRYAFLIYTDELSDPKACSASVAGFNQRAREAGVFEAAQPLQDVSTATTVRVRDGKTVVTDGPFAETKEQLAGFYLFDCDNPEHWVEQLPMARTGSVEIRPIMEIPSDT